MFPTKLPIISQPSTAFSNTYSLGLDGSDDYVNIGDVSDLDFGTSAFSVSFWAKTTHDGYQALFGKQDTSSGWYLYYYHTYDRIDFYHRKDVRYTYGADSSFPNDGAWRHCLFTRNGATGTIYINGVDITNTGTSQNISGDVDSSGDDCEIGRRLLGSTDDRYVNGNIDEVAIWDEVLDADAATAVYNSGVPFDLTANKGNYDNSNDLVGYWRFEEGSGTSVADSSDNSNTGTLVNTPTWSADVPS